MPGSKITIEQVERLELKSQSITAFMLGLKSRMATFHVQRDINNYKKEPMLAILPGAVLSEFWQIMKVLENTLRLVSVLILIASLLGLSAMLLASIRERNREIQLLRVIGASPIFIFFLIELEALIVSFLSMVLGAALLYLCLVCAKGVLVSDFGVHVQANIFSENALYLLFLILFSTIVAASIPSINAYKSASSV